MSPRPGSTSWSTGPSSSARPGWCGCASRDGGALESPVAEVPVSEAEQLGLVDALGGAARRPVLIAAGARRLVDHVLGTLAPRPRPPAGARGRPALPAGSSTSRCSRRSTTTAGPIPAHHPFTMPHPDDLEHARRTARARTCSRCARSPTTSCSTAGSSARAACGSTGRDMQQQIFTLLGIDDEDAQAALRLPARRVPLRRAAARRLRVRHRPARRDPRGRGQHPRGDRVPEDPVGRRPAHRRAHAPSTRRSSRSSASRSCPGRRR